MCTTAAAVSGAGMRLLLLLLLTTAFTGSVNGTGTIDGSCAGAVCVAKPNSNLAVLCPPDKCQKVDS
jgi:hypothetical protein